MICEIRINLVANKVTALYHSNMFVYEIEKICE